MKFDKSEGVIESGRTFKFRLKDPQRPDCTGDIFLCDGLMWRAACIVVTDDAYIVDAHRHRPRRRPYPTVNM